MLNNIQLCMYLFLSLRFIIIHIKKTCIHGDPVKNFKIIRVDHSVNNILWVIGTEILCLKNSAKKNSAIKEPG